MGWNQLVAPNPATQDGAGWCLRFAQSVFGAPARYNSAWDAWNATQYKHADWDMPEQGIAHPVWFSHWGTYGDPPRYDNWGHVAVRMEDGRILSSPGSGYGQQWFNSIGEIERYFNAQYVGWSEDLNGLRIIDYTAPQPTITGDDDMYAVVQYDDGWAGFWNMATGQATHIDTVEEWNRIATKFPIWKFADSGAFNAWKIKYGAVLPLNVDANAIAAAVVAQLGNTEINVDALAAAIAAQIDTTCNCGCGVPIPGPDTTTKEEILASIEANYPEDK